MRRSIVIKGTELTFDPFLSPRTTERIGQYGGTISSLKRLAELVGPVVRNYSSFLSRSHATGLHSKT